MNLSIGHSNVEVGPDLSYIGIEQTKYKSKQACSNSEESTVHNEYSKNIKGTYKLGTHQNSLEGTFKFEQEKWYSQNSKSNLKEMFQDTMPNESHQNKFIFNSSVN